MTTMMITMMIAMADRNHGLLLALFPNLAFVVLVLALTPALVCLVDEEGVVADLYVGL